MENASKNQAKKNFLSFYFNPRDNRIMHGNGALDDGTPTSYSVLLDPRNTDILKTVFNNNDGTQNIFRMHATPQSLFAPDMTFGRLGYGK